MNALCDEESSSDESDRQTETTDPVKPQRAPQRVSTANKSFCIEKSTQIFFDKMSAKQAEEQMKIIQSESQRLARECHLR